MFAKSPIAGKGAIGEAVANRMNCPGARTIKVGAKMLNGMDVPTLPDPITGPVFEKSKRPDGSKGELFGDMV